MRTGTAALYALVGLVLADMVTHSTTTTPPTGTLPDTIAPADGGTLAPESFRAVRNWI